MPYQVYHEDGEYVVRKKNEDGTPGKVFGHHGQDKAKAEAQVRALYASEKPVKNSTQFLFSNSFRSVTLDDKEWLVVPGVPLREQVMNDYFVPADEIARATIGWNGTPISISHPKLNGGSVNVPAPDVGVIGKFFDAKFDAESKRMTGDYWIDVESANKFVEGAQILEAIRNGKVLETSTGYWAEDEMIQGELNGRGYKTIHRNLLPDHIAILTKEIGACSVKDGCGLNRNSDIFQNCDSCDCPFKNNANIPPYVKDHLPAEMLVGYCYNKGSRTQEQLNKMREYIKANGIDKPVMILANEDQIKIVDGNHRVAMAAELGIDQVPVKIFNEDLQPVDPEILYTKWMHVQDQSYLNSKIKSNTMDVPANVKNHPMFSEALYKTMLEKKMTPDEMVKMMDGMKTNSNVQPRRNLSRALKINQKKESVKMKFEELQTLLQTKGIMVNAGEGDEFEVEETPVTEPAAVPGLSANELAALKALAASATKLNAQAEKLDKIDGALAMAANYEAQQKAEKETLVATIKTNSANPYSDEELAGMSMPVLVKLNATMNVNYGGLAGASNLFQNEEVLVVPSSLLVARKDE